ncbi:hypothetical protein C9J12_10490 [Photobacterium frigidiphilum]|uniref:HTH gntR-type domain-containing protein n=1 Tax=Photobacterium frigidiphilum TaxID=264736 RepID=A0A2T3JIW8_9GAMM|nr:winged helix-turn-helix domain-containing protein [Photobacterium frigidiphilum]PSU48918.1 hypothetical protein C9J12_10490 [Photobacterium frigidiphilum]
MLELPVVTAQNYIIECIINRVYADGFFLPNQKELSEILGVSLCTLRNALKILEAEGWIKIEHGKGSLVLPFMSYASLATATSRIMHMKGDELSKKIYQDATDIKQRLVQKIDHCNLVHQLFLNDLKRITSAIDVST